MINIILKGMDIYLANEFSEKLTSPLTRVTSLSEEKISVIAYESMIYHKGIDQTSMHLFVDVECDKKLQYLENEISEVIFNLAKQFAIHTHILFKYFEMKNYHEAIDEQYPLYLDASNVAKVEAVENADDVEIYDGNIFQDFENVFPNDEKKEN